jgi:spermidine synthase
MRRTSSAATLLFFSGACALTYQTTWFRQFRLIFGASTFATAAVLAIFMGGLGLGSIVLGKRADRHPRPLAFYGALELMIAAAAALSQPLLWLVARIYIALGGSTTLGNSGATIVRLILAAIVLAIPTFLMGGTLPAAARAVETTEDEGRRNLAVLYAVNTLGAVAGTLLSTFWLLEHLGNRNTLFAAMVVNIIVGTTALFLAAEVPTETAGEEEQRESAVPPAFVLAAAATVGFAFLLMELVWYRMLSPLLGGTTFMFGLILAIALLGIGLGGAAYSLRGRSANATVGGFALTCMLEAAAIILPYALGDRIAVVTNLLRPLGHIGFFGYVLGWSAITLVTVFPAAFISGIQFPLLIGLLGRGREKVGRHVGLAYAFNTAGAILGSLAGGFGLLPLLSAPGCWLLAAVLLLAIGVVAVILGARARQFAFSATALAAAVLAIAGTTAMGPTAVWRHSGIGAGRSPQPGSKPEIREWENAARRILLWGEDGRESSIAVASADEYAFIVNGKADGSARGDAGTQVMSGILAATIHPNPRSALVIGLGTGSTAGWLGAIPIMERVDVVELEPVVLRVARDFAAVNHDVLKNPKVHIQIADAREVLLVSRRRYDIIFSEPSNPFRAGIASLFTREFYEGVSQRLAPGGMFVQWVQAYDVDSTTVATIYRTMNTVFPHVDTWRATWGDLLLVATREPMVYDADMIRQRVLHAPFGPALSYAWRTEGLEGFFSHYVGSNGMARAIAATANEINTDDRTPIEFGFARGLGSETAGFDTDRLIALAQKRNEYRPKRMHGAINWNLVLLHRASDPDVKTPPPYPLPQYETHHEFARAYEGGDLSAARSIWDPTRFPAINSRELVAQAEANADVGREEAVPMAMQLRGAYPAECEAILGRVRERQKKYDEAATHIVNSYVAYRTDAWPTRDLMGRNFDVATALARRSPAVAQQIYGAIDKQFVAGQWEDARKYYRVFVGQAIRPCGPAMLRALGALEPWPPWRENLLRPRLECYSRAHLTTLADNARDDLREFMSTQPQKLEK